MWLVGSWTAPLLTAWGWWAGEVVPGVPCLTWTMRSWLSHHSVYVVTLVTMTVLAFVHISLDSGEGEFTKYSSLPV